jgi:hypothetical protein
MADAAPPFADAVPLVLSPKEAKALAAKTAKAAKEAAAKTAKNDAAVKIPKTSLDVMPGDVVFTDKDKKVWDKQIKAIAKAEKAHAEKETKAKAKADAARVKKEVAEKAKADKAKKVRLEKEAKEKLQREKAEAALKAKAEKAKAPIDVAAQLKMKEPSNSNDSHDVTSQKLTANADGLIEPTKRGIYPEGCIVEVLCGEGGEEVWVPARVDEVLQYEDRVGSFHLLMLCYKRVK